MKRKILALVLVCVIAGTMGLLTGCGAGESKTDWEYIKDKGTLVIGLDDTFAPMGFRDKDNKLVGFDIDLARAVGKELGVKVKFKPIEWKAKEAELKSKNIDCIWNGMSATPDRQKSMSLSKKYLENKILVMSLNPSLNIKIADELKNYKIGTQAGSAALEAIQKNSKYDEFKDNISEYDTYDQAILDMKAGRIDAVAIDQVYAIYNNANKDRLYQSDFNFGADYYAVGFRKEDKETTKKFNEALKKVIDNGQAEEISQKWFGTNMVVFEGYSK